MLSSLETYSFYTRDLQATYTRLSEESTNAREAAYYLETIQTITSVDEFMDNDRVYNYAMLAYGLEEMTYAKGLMRKVLESDLSDESSFANLLTDTRYTDFAAAFDFGNTQSTATIQTTDQQDELIEAYEQTIAQANANQNEEVGYFQAVMALTTDVTEIFTYPRAVEFILTAVGLDPDNYDYDTLVGALSSAPDDPTSYVNTVIQPNIDQYDTERSNLIDERTALIDSGEASETEYNSLTGRITAYGDYTDKLEKYVELASLFNFNSDGSLSDGVSPQTDEQLSEIKERYIRPDDSVRVTYNVALLNEEYYRETIPNIDQLDDILLFDDRLRTMTLTAFNINLDITRVEMYEAFSYDPDDPDSPIHDLGAGLVEFVRAFNFDEYGQLIEGEEVQSSESIDEAMSNYLVTYGDDSADEDQDDIDQFQRNIYYTADLDDFLSSELAANLVREFALKAYGIGEDEFSIGNLRSIFTSDPTDPNSYLNRLDDERVNKLFNSFNFNEEGEIGPPRTAQTEAEITRISVAYLTERTRLDDSDSTRADAEDEIEYYREQMRQVQSAEELANDARLREFIAVAEGLDIEVLNNELLLELLISDKNDPESFSNQQTDVILQQIAGSYNFGVSGLIENYGVEGAQSSRGLAETSNMYISQLMEAEAGDTSLGARLALYFERKASDISSIYEIIADDAIGQFIRTTFSIPDEIASSDVDAQAEYYERFVTLEDFQDPDKIAEMVQRFLALYDIENVTDNTVATLFSGSTSFNAETLASFAQYRSQI